MSTLISPPLSSTDTWFDAMTDHGYAVLPQAEWVKLLGCQTNDLLSLNDSWNDLVTDQYLKDGGRYRRRRHSCYQVGNQVQLVPHRAHWQPIEYNALHGGMQRWFEPISGVVQQSTVWSQLIQTLAQMCTRLKPSDTWYVEAHQFRIDTTDGIGRPTPEGAHRDGVDFVAVVMIGREGIKGGETRVFDAHGPDGQRFTLSESWSVLFLDDERVIHESTPIQPLADTAHRDTLVLTFRRNGFQGD